MIYFWEGVILLAFTRIHEKQSWDIAADRVRRPVHKSTPPMDPAIWGRLPGALLEWFLVTYGQLHAVRLCNSALRRKCRALYERRREQQLQFCLRYAQLQKAMQPAVPGDIRLQVVWMYSEEDGGFLAKVPMAHGMLREWARTGEVWDVYLEKREVRGCSNTYDVVGARFDDQKFRRLSLLLRLRLKP